MAETWLTYTEIGERFSITPEAARHLARRRMWRKQIGNNGRTRVLVPDDTDIEPRSRTPVERPADARSSTGEADALRELVAELRTAADRDRAAWIVDRDRLVAAAERERADRIEERDRLLAELERERQTATTAQAELRATLDRATARLAELNHRPWWRRFMG